MGRRVIHMPTTWTLSAVETAVLVALVVILTGAGSWAMHIR
jgi:hypothetical protein